MSLAATNQRIQIIMIEDIYFLDEGQVRVTAATVGISKQRWTSVNEQEINDDKYIDLMINNRFDHLPIEPPNGVITEYFKTAKPNDFTKIIRHSINYEDVIPLDTSINNVINKFASTGRTFYFLTFHKSISGLITLGNLNCKQVQVYIFSLICELERELGDFLNSYMTNEQIEDWLNNKVKSNNSENKYYLMLTSYEELIRHDLENMLTEHFFLIDFFNIISNKKLYTKLSFSKKEWEKLNSINELRKRIAHPTRSLLDKDNNIIKLGERLNKIDDLTFRLVTLRKTKATNIKL